MTNAQRLAYLAAILGQRFPIARPFAIATLLLKARQFSNATEAYDVRVCNGEYDEDEQAKHSARFRARADALMAEFWGEGMEEVGITWGNVAGASLFVPGKRGDGINGGWWL